MSREIDLNVEATPETKAHDPSETYAAARKKWRAFGTAMSAMLEMRMIARAGSPETARI